MESIVDNARDKEKEDSVQDLEIKTSELNREAKEESPRKVEVKRNHSSNPNYISSI